MFKPGDEVRICYSTPGVYHEGSPDALSFVEKMEEYYGETDQVDYLLGDFVRLKNNAWTWHQDWLELICIEDDDWGENIPDLLELYN